MKKSPLTPSKVIKIPEFTGSLSTRALYVYLPPGYLEQQDVFYPVLYMHDGQNCFETFVGDSFSGSWRADRTADRLITQGEMQPCIIVGVSNGGKARIVEYLPPYVRQQVRQSEWAKGSRPKQPVSIIGHADRTVAYYRDEVHDYVRSHYRVLDGRENIATCGSSMGGLFSTYMAWEHPRFAHGHAIMSPSFWITDQHGGRAGGPYQTIERFRTGVATVENQRRALRLWLDCGSWGGAVGQGSDGLPLLLAARDALHENGFAQGPDFRVYLDEGAIHHESAWAARLDKVFRFLFPARDDKRMGELEEERT